MGFKDCVENVFAAILSYAMSCHSYENIPSWKIEEFNAVTHFESLGDYYLEIRSQNSHSDQFGKPKQPEMSTVKGICENIFTSPYFKIMKEEDWLNTDCEITRAELRAKSTIFKKICQKSTIWHKLWSGDDCVEDFQYRNLYKLRPLAVETRTAKSEWVLVCLTKERESQTIVEYFVSMEYNLNSPDVDYAPIYARFIFTRDNEKKLIIRAMAEEHTVLLKTYQTKEYHYEWLYWNERDRFENYDSPEDDPICQLTPAEKLRLCTTIFSSSPFQNTLIFFPSLDNVQIGCKQQNVSFNAEKRQPRTKGELDLYKDWMMACKVSLLDRTDWRETFYISRGMRTNHVFVHESVGGQVFVLFYMINAGVMNQIYSI